MMARLIPSDSVAWLMAHPWQPPPMVTTTVSSSFTVTRLA